MDFFILRLLEKKSLEPDGFTGEFPKISLKRINTNSICLFQKIEEEGTLFTSFFELDITHIPKPDRQYKQNKTKQNKKEGMKRGKERRKKREERSKEERKGGRKIGRKGGRKDIPYEYRHKNS